MDGSRVAFCLRKITSRSCHTRSGWSFTSQKLAAECTLIALVYSEWLRACDPCEIKLTTSGLVADTLSLTLREESCQVQGCAPGIFASGRFGAGMRSISLMCGTCPQPNGFSFQRIKLVLRLLNSFALFKSGYFNELLMSCSHLFDV